MEELQQIEYFFMDCVIPSLKDRTRFSDVWKTYLTYCQAIDQMPEMTQVGFAKALKAKYVPKKNQGKQYYCVKIRDNLFIQE